MTPFRAVAKHSAKGTIGLADDGMCDSYADDYDVFHHDIGSK